MSNSPRQLSNARVSVISLNSSGPIEAMAVVQLDSTGGIVSGGVGGGGSTQVSIREILTSSGASVIDSTNNAINVNVVAGAAAGSTAVTVRQSTYTDNQALAGIRDRDASTNIAAVLNAQPASTTYGLVVRDVSTGPFVISSVGGAVIVRSTQGTLLASVYQSTQSDLRATIYQSTQADLRATIYQSTGADLNVTAIQGSSSWSVQARVTTSSGGSVEGSTVTPAVGSLGLNVRQVRPVLQTAASTAGSDTLATVVAGSTAAGTGKIYVNAFHVTSTVDGPVNCGFYSMSGGASTLIWPVVIWAGGGVVNVGQSMTHPGYLFATSTGSTLTFQVATTGAYRFGVTYSTGA